MGSVEANKCSPVPCAACGDTVAFDHRVRVCNNQWAAYLAQQVEAAIENGCEFDGGRVGVQVTAWVGSMVDAVLQGGCRIVVKIDLACSMSKPAFVDQEESVRIGACRQWLY